MFPKIKHLLVKKILKQSFIDLILKTVQTFQSNEELIIIITKFLS